MTDTDRDHTGDAAPTSAFAAWRDPDFGRYSLAYVPSMSATWIRITAMGYLVYELTADPLKLGMISFATAIPQLILSPLSGTFIDRVNRRNLLVTVQLLIVVVMAATAVLIGIDRITYPMLLAIAVILGSLITFDWPVRLALIPSLVPRSLLQNAIALNTTMFNVSRVFGPTLAGWLIALVGMTWAFGVTALLMVPFPLVLLTIPRLRTLVVPKQPGSAWSQLAAGYRYIARNRQIAALMLMNLVPNVLGMSYVLMAPAYVSDVLNEGATTLGYLLAVNGIGSFIGTFTVARFHQFRRRGAWILRTLAVFGTLLIVFGLTSNLWVALASIFLLGLTYGFVAALNDTLIQLLVDEAYRGRVMSVFAMIVGLAPGSALLVGWIATMTGIGWAIAIIGIAMLVYLPFLIFRTQLGTID
jgi:MFS family permease